MSNDKLLQVLLSPHVSEKTSMSQGYAQYAFKVAPFANKLDVKNAVESLFNVKVKGVNVNNVKPRTVRFGRGMGKQSGWKKAYVTLAKGEQIELGQA